VSTVNYAEPTAAGASEQLTAIVGETEGGAFLQHVRAKDVLTGGEILADQDGAGAVLTFTFSQAMDVVWVQSRGADLVSRVDPFGGTPSATSGIPALDDTPVPLTVRATAVKVYAPAGATVCCWGYRY
jgi:hypothetical protein